MDNLEILKDKIKDQYTYTEFAEDILGIKRLALYRKLNNQVPFNKLEKEKIKELFNVEI